jgi:hypothetical protein
MNPSFLPYIHRSSGLERSGGRVRLTPEITAALSAPRK